MDDERGVAGLLISAWSMHLVNALLPATIPRVGRIDFDARVLSFTAMISVLAGLIFGLAPTFQSTRLPLMVALRYE